MDTVSRAVEDAAENITSVAAAIEENAFIGVDISPNTEKALSVTGKAVSQASAVSLEVAQDIAVVDQSSHHMLLSNNFNKTAAKLSALAGQLQGLVGKFKLEISLNQGSIL